MGQSEVDAFLKFQISSPIFTKTARAEKDFEDDVSVGNIANFLVEKLKITF